MDETTRILMDHHRRHPLMQTEDYVKLLYQNVFGPKHFSADPDLESVKRYLHEELATPSPENGAPAFEDIGGGFWRANIDIVTRGQVGADELATAFHRTMLDCPVPDAKMIESFKTKVAVFLTLAAEGALGLAPAAAEPFVEAFYQSGIRASHHSAAYRQAYHPHYRVIHVKYLSSWEAFMANQVTVKMTKFRGIDRNPSLLGFGCMRLPTLSGDKPDIDEVAAQKMIDDAYAHGVTYFDTAYPYHRGLSELFIGKALKKYPRDSFFLASKMPGWLVQSRADAERLFEEQLRKCQVDYFDYYLCHALGEENFKPYLLPGVMEFLRQMKAEGKIRHLGFSFHDSTEALDKIIHTFAWDFVQLQINYLDWNFQDAKGKYEIVEQYGVPCIVMEPVRGGLLATLSEESRQIFREADPDSSVASWAIRYAASKPNVMVVLSGMSNAEQTRDNIHTLSAFRPLSPAERGVIARALDAFLKNRTIPCTACGYCMPCPHGVDIPHLFRIHNEYAMAKRKRDFIYVYEDTASEKRSDRCVACGECMPHCPQQILIPERMKDITNLYAEIKQEAGMGMKIVNAYRERMPATRFIGRRYGDEDRNAFGGFGDLWSEWLAKGWFEPLKALCLDTPEGGSYVGLMRCVPRFQYWIGVFCPAGTAVPEGLLSVDFPAFDIVVAWVKGKEENGEIYGAKAHDASVAAGRAKGFAIKAEPWYFERYHEPRFCHKDAAGDIILDYCIELE